MKDGTIEILGKTYTPAMAENGRCCDVCEIGQLFCSFECQEFEEPNECLTMKLIDNNDEK